MITQILEFFGVPTYDVSKAEGICFLPPPVAPRAKTAKPKPEPGVYAIDAERNYFGFRDDSTGSREGATAWLTSYDLETLNARPDLFGKGKEVRAQNEACKKHWFEGVPKSDAAKLMNRSESWLEKRYAAFSAALSRELHETA